MSTEPEILPHSVWKHLRKGSLYRVVMLTNEHSEKPEFPATVVYMGEDGKVWSRRKDDWHRSFEFVGLNYGSWGPGGFMAAGDQLPHVVIKAGGGGGPDSLTPVGQ